LPPTLADSVPKPRSFRTQISPNSDRFEPNSGRWLTVLKTQSDKFNEYIVTCKLRLLHMMNVRFSLLNMAQRILGVTLPNF
jgi:hypothetical protein